MGKRLILALALAVLVLSIYSNFTSKYLLEPEKQIKGTPVARPEVEKAVSPPVSKTPAAEIKFTTLRLQTPNLNLALASPGGSIVGVELKQYQDDKTKGAVTLLQTQDVRQGIFVLGGSDFFDEALKQGVLSSNLDSATYVFETERYRLQKTLTLHKDKYFSELEICLDNKSNQDWTENYAINILTYRQNRDIDSRFDQIVIQNTEKPIRFSPSKIKDEMLLYSGEVDWVGIRQRYFSLIVKPEFPTCSVKAYRSGSVINIVLNDSFNLGAGQSLRRRLVLFTGPSLSNALQYKNLGMETILDSGVIAATLLYALHFFYTLSQNWGLSIILLSVLIYVIFLPLTAKSMSSMKKMQTLAPKIEELRQTYKDNPQKMNKAVMEVYKQHKVNPLGGCLPLLLQLPIFFALYRTLMHAVELKGAGLLWIKDLSLPDRALILPNNLPLIGNEINILPLIMGVAMFFQQKLSMVSGGQSQQAEQQRMMSIMMPILFCFIFYKFPAGLVLYWLTNTLLMLIYYYKIRHLHAIAVE